jgi:hypothetical protein
VLLVLLGVIGASRASELFGSRETEAAVTYRGNLTHNWQGPVNGACDFEFQFYDAELNGVALGAPILIERVELEQGQFAIPMTQDTLALPQDGSVQPWLGVSVRCGDSFSALGPRLRHSLSAAANADASANLAGWEVPESSGALLCALPESSGATPQHASGPPTLGGAEYSLQGGFWAGASAK